MEYIITVLEAVGVITAVAGSVLVTSTFVAKRRVAFIAFIISSSAALPLFTYNELYSYAALQVFYLITAGFGFYNLRGSNGL